MNENSIYTLKENGDIVTLKTASFRAERGSVLHSGIFNRELASSFLAATAAVTVLILFAVFSELHLVSYVIVLVVFIVVLPLSRIYVFGETYIETVFDRGSKTVSVHLKRAVGSRKIKKSMDSLRDITIDHIRIEPENPDGIAIVEKIALQHGTVIPGFGEVKEFYNVDLKFEDAGYTVLSTSSEDDARAVVETLKKYIEDSLQQAGKPAS
ncbi:hypothetical protein BMS3Abin07_01714 [bacterium BMS3Abin07]|nr:hypothetical protein BMS3Abin07_01714 [bacterium BMS3Abin07]GBE33323.1 hypothetical protein BMS3Bbin05_02262 [bacterium BMS3Bbin05]HDL21309.1 hypothetical protein [Nitrospirota bacterium]HDO22228.1 hypothetical protein [Nitrospirota bacterium]HDZ88047.1 hypothetical protein [Nitrospirota bacterium]